jgi:7-cyano-7-deazaguanine synthase in queuosine biosynthesis
VDSSEAFRFILKDSMTDTLLMFSGGLDSTGAFWKLHNDGVGFDVHHMVLKNQENRGLAESIASANILNYMRALGWTGHYTESTHEYPSFNRRFLWDADMTSFMAGYICSVSRNIKKVALGLTLSDMQERAIPGRIERANKVFSAMCDAEKIYPVSGLTKLEIFQALPETLRDFCWYCRTPNYISGIPEKCNRCKTCRVMAKLLYNFK